MSKESQESALDALRVAKASEGLLPEIQQGLSDLIRTDRLEFKEAIQTPEGGLDSASDFLTKLQPEIQYAQRLETLEYYGFLQEGGESKEGDVSPPSSARLMASFTPEELEIASRFQEPVILLVPENSFGAKVNAMNAHKQPFQEADAYVNENFCFTDSGSEKIEGWRAFIVEGVTIHKNDPVHNPKEGNVNGPRKGMDRHRYTLLLMDYLKNGKVLDAGTLTILDDDSVFGHAGIEDLYSRFYIDTYSSPPRSLIPPRAPLNEYNRFRSSVGGNVLFTG